MAHVQRATGRAAAIDADHVGKYERGLVTWPNKWYRLAFLDLFQTATDAELGFYSKRSFAVSRDGTVRPDAESQVRTLGPVDRRQFLSGLAGAAFLPDLPAGRRIGAHEVDEFRRLRHDLERRDDRIGGDRLYDAGFLQTRRLSQVMKMSRLATEAHRPRDAVDLAQQALAIRGITARTRSLLHMREALGWALFGDGNATAQAITTATGLLERGPRPTDPAWLDFYDAAELEGLVATCQSSLGRHRDARRRREVSLRVLRPAYVRNRLLQTIGVAEATLALGEADEAVQSAGAALVLLGEVASARATERLDRLHRRLVRVHGDVATVREFSERYRAAT